MATDFVRTLVERGVRDRTAGLEARSELALESFSYIDEGGLPTSYVINYTFDTLTGWLMISADKRVEPLLAFSNSGHRIRADGDLPGLRGHREAVAARIKEVREKKTKDNSVEEHDIAQLSKTICIDPWGNWICDTGGNPPSNQCTSTSVTYGPLLTTEWNQGCPYNLRITDWSCSDACGQPSPVMGCIPVAMAQIARFHQAPAGFRYNEMLNRYTVAAADRAVAARQSNVGDLLATMGFRANAHYGCDATWAEPWNIDRAFRDLGYASGGTRVDWSPLTIFNEVQAGRPVLIEGRETTTSGWHVWVADGYRREQYSWACDRTYAWTHMNWGWGGRGNAWYAVGVWQPIDQLTGQPFSSDYSTYNKIIYGIRP